MLSISQNAVVVALLAGGLILLLLAIRSVVLNKRVLTLLEEQSLAIQKLSAEVFEMQNTNSEATRNILAASQAMSRMDRDVQNLGATVATLKSTGQGASGEAMLQLGKEIRKTLQSREVTEFLDSASKN